MVQCVQALSGARGWTGRAQSWANVSPKGGGGHVAHAHAGTLSGVFFVSVVGSQDFCYRPPDAGFFGSPAAACVPVASGDVLVFPSFMLHHVPPFAGERISIAFNLLLAPGDAGTLRLDLGAGHESLGKVAPRVEILALDSAAGSPAASQTDSARTGRHDLRIPVVSGWAPDLAGRAWALLEAAWARGTAVAAAVPVDAELRAAVAQALIDAAKALSDAGVRVQLDGSPRWAAAVTVLAPATERWRTGPRGAGFICLQQCAGLRVWIHAAQREGWTANDAGARAAFGAKAGRTLGDREVLLWPVDVEVAVEPVGRMSTAALGIHVEF